MKSGFILAISVVISAAVGWYVIAAAQTVQPSEGQDHEPLLYDTAGNRLSLSMPGIAPDQKARLILLQLGTEISRRRTSLEEAEGRALSVLDDCLASETRSNVYKFLAEQHMSTPDGQILTERLVKAEGYLVMALRQANVVGQKLYLTHRLADAKQRLVQHSGQSTQAAARSEIARVIWEGLRAAKEADLPPHAPERLVSSDRMGIFDTTVAVTEEGRRDQAARQLENRRRMEEAQARDALIAAVHSRDSLENRLAELYALNPLQLDELKELGAAIVGDEAYVERIVQKAADEYDRRYQEHLELNKHVFEKK